MQKDPRPCLKQSDLAAGGTCPRFIPTRQLSTSAPGCMWQPLAQTATPTRSGHSRPLPTTCTIWRTGLPGAGSRPSQWSPPASTGFRPTRCWSSAGSRWCWSMPATPSTCRAARPTSAMRSGCSGYMNTACCGAASGRRPRSRGCGPICGNVRDCSTTLQLTSSTCRRR